MFDFRMLLLGIYDGYSTGAEMVAAAEEVGLIEICSTNHLSYISQVIVRKSSSG